MNFRLIIFYALTLLSSHFSANCAKQYIMESPCVEVINCVEPEFRCIHFIIVESAHLVLVGELVEEET